MFRWLWRWGRRVVFTICVVLLTVLTVRAVEAWRGPPLELWHSFVPHELTWVVEHVDKPAEAPRFVGDVSGGGAVRRFATDASLVKINRAQITLTLGAGSEGPLMEFMLGSDDKRTAASAASARQASAARRVVS